MEYLDFTLRIRLGRPTFLEGETNQPPLPSPDDATTGTGAPVIIDVLVNDTDPEGGALDLISAVAATGTAEVQPDDTILYTPAPNFVGTDTVTYTVTDPQGAAGQGTLTVTVTGPALTISSGADGELTIDAGTGAITVTVTSPVELIGSYAADTADLALGPINLAPPAILGVPDEGATLTARAGLWIYDTGAGVPAQAWQWRRAGVDIPGATAASYVVVAADAGQALTLVETQADGFGSRAAESVAAGSGAFTPTDDAQLLGWWDAGDGATITESAGAVSAWADKAGGASLTPGATAPVTGARTLGGLNVIDFAGGRHLEAARSWPASGDFAIHGVFVIDVVANPFEAILAIDAANDFQIDANAAAQFDGRLNATGIGSGVALSGGPFAGAVILSLVFDRSGSGQAEVFVGGVSRGTMAYGVAVDASAALHLMTNRAKNAWINGAVGELIVTADVTNRVAHHDHLAAKWGLV